MLKNSCHEVKFVSGPFRALEQHAETDKSLASIRLKYSQYYQNHLYFYGPNNVNIFECCNTNMNKS